LLRLHARSVQADVRGYHSERASHFAGRGIVGGTSGCAGIAEIIPLPEAAARAQLSQLTMTSQAVDDL
jgi:hypothetical protein